MSAAAADTGPGAGPVTVLDGSSFCRSGQAGDITPDRSEGMFVHDTRVLSTWQLLVDDRPVTALAVDDAVPYRAVFTGRADPRTPHTDPTVVITRTRVIGTGLREDITVHNFGTEPLGATITLQAGADFADLFAVKDGRPRRQGTLHRQVAADGVHLWASLAGQRRGIRIRSNDGAEMRSREGLTWRPVIPPHGSWHTTVHAVPTFDGEEAALSFPDGQPAAADAPSRRLALWEDSLPRIDCESPALSQALDRSLADLGALRLPDPADPDRTIIAAGAPWFMTLFGRDSLITSMMCLPFAPDLARGTLYALAARQGTRAEPFSEEEPGKILHEVRAGLTVGAGVGASPVYYGSVDATPLFVMLLDQASQWGLPDQDVTALLPAADRALEWIDRYGDIDGDGLVEYQRKTDRGLANQGWKDSFDSINDHTGRLAAGPIALAEVQGYIYAAWRGRARLARRAGDQATAHDCDRKADHVRVAFEDAFWLPDRGYYALALDGDKHPVDALASNQGHCLWTGIASPDHVDALAERLTNPAMFTGWGIRTLASTMAAYNPISYHNGSVWPHDNALAVAGLIRYGHTDQAATIAAALIDASATTGGRLPELFCGFGRGDAAAPVSYPTACSPQAWAAATPLSLLTSLFGLRPDLDNQTIHATPHLPEKWGKVTIHDLPLGPTRHTVHGGSAS